MSNGDKTLLPCALRGFVINITFKIPEVDLAENYIIIIDERVETSKNYYNILKNAAACFS